MPIYVKEFTLQLQVIYLPLSFYSVFRNHLCFYHFFYFSVFLCTFISSLDIFLFIFKCIFLSVFLSFFQTIVLSSFLFILKSILLSIFLFIYLCKLSFFHLYLELACYPSLLIHKGVHRGEGAKKWWPPRFISVYALALHCWYFQAHGLNIKMQNLITARRIKIRNFVAGWKLVRCHV